ncbi:unnamed protein product [Cercopithifilaria johnstoni]|uniref:Uncharacterized protein n=1 Tax=Cercopithifilaria johnstoni TaxID=2874296 RepID=A0A8J2QA93_9BILA|nr:unnamed protein product [Cercopithifilaria johnstoni]
MDFRNYRNGNIPEIGTTIYNTIPTGGDTFFDRLSDSEQNETGRRSRHKRGLGISHAKTFNVSQSRRHTQLPKSKIRSNSTPRRRRMKTRRNGVILPEYENDVDDKNSQYVDLITRSSCNRRSDDYYENVFRSAGNHRIKKSKSGLRLQSGRKLSVPLYDGTYSVRDYTSPDLRNIGDTEDETTSGAMISLLGIPDRKKSRMEQQNAKLKAALVTDKKQQCFLQLPISVITEQCIRVISTTRQSWLQSTIYIFSNNQLGHCNIEQLDGMLTGASIMNRETYETEWDKRPLNLKEDIFVKNNIIKIRRSTLFCDLQNGKQITTNDRRTYNNLCPAEMTNVAQREIYGNVALRPQSMLNVTSMYDEQRSVNGNIRLIEKLIITLSSSEEPQATQRLQKQIEQRIIEPENYDIPIQYTEDVLTGPRRIDITREAEINPREGLSDFMTTGEPRVIEFGEIRRYGNLVPSRSRSLGGIQTDYPIQRTSSLTPLIDRQIRQIKETTPRQFPSSSSYISREFKQLKSADLADKHEKEQIVMQKIQPEKRIEVPVVREVSANGIPIINGISESPVATKQKQLGDSVKHGKTDSRSKKSRTVRSLRRSSRWNRFALLKPQTQTHPASTESIRTVPATFSPLETSTPVRRYPKEAKDLNEQKKFVMEERVKTSRSQSSGTGTHIRSTLDCDITLSTTKEMNVTEIPIEIKGALNGLPWCTTIRLRIKHDANEKPTFIPNRCKIFWYLS